MASPHFSVALPLSICSTGVALSPRRVDSTDLDRQLGKKAGYVEKRSGMTCRFHADKDASQSDLAVAALDDALARGGIAPASIDLLISASAIPVQALPFTAVHVLKASRLSAGIACMDINASCVSFIHALQVAAGLLNGGAYRRIAIVSSDLASRGIDWAHEESSLIFGDGAACAIVERGDGRRGVIACLNETYPDGSDYCEIRAGGTRRNPRAGIQDSDFLFHMDGKQIFRHAATLIDGFFDRLLRRSELSLSDISAVIPHQASHVSLEHMRRRLKVPKEVLVNIYRERGNQVAASIPSALHAAFIDGRLVSGRPAMLIGTGAGLSLSGMTLLP